MAFEFPLDLYLQVQQEKNRNRQNMYQDMAGIGQGLGQGLGAIGDAMKTHQLKKLVEQMIKSQQQPGQPPPTAGIGGVQTAPPQQPQMDPMMQRILPFLKADPSMIPQALPALIKGGYLSQRGQKTPGAMTDYQGASLAQRDQQFKDRMKAMGDIQSFKQQMEQQVLMLRKRGLKKEADALDARVKEWTAQHWLLSSLGYGPTSDDSGGGMAGEDSGGGMSDEGWGPVQVSQ